MKKHVGHVLAQGMTHYQHVSPFFQKTVGEPDSLVLNAVLHYITCAVDDVDTICPNFQDETGTTCCIFT